MKYLIGVWNYILNYLTDNSHREIFSAGRDSNSLREKLLLMSPMNVTKAYGSKGSMWKDTSHEGHTLLQRIHITKNDDIEDWATFPLGILSDFSGKTDFS